MSKLLATQISNYNDNGPVEVKDGVNEKDKQFVEAKVGQFEVKA